MKKFLVVVFFCLPAGKRRTRVGVCTWARRRMVRRSADLENAYACFVSNTNVINYATPIASWGAEYLRLDRYDNALTVRQFDWSGDAEHTCRFRKYNRVRHEREHQREPKYIWQTYDQPSINAWNIKGFCPRSLPPMSKRQELRRSP